MWESHSEREWNSDASRDRDYLGESDESLNVGCLQMKLQVVPQVSGARGHGRGMRPAGRSMPFPQSKIKDLTTKGGMLQ